MTNDKLKSEVRTTNCHLPFVIFRLSFAKSFSPRLCGESVWLLPTRLVVEAIMTRRFRPFVILATSLAWVSAPARIEQSASQPWRGQGVVHLDKSPYAKLRSVPIRAVRMQDGFWGRRRKVTIEKSIPSIRALIEEHGYADNFRRLSKSKKVERKGPVFADTDPYKWIEAVGVFLQS